MATEKEDKKPAEKPISLQPLEFEEAISALLRVDPEKIEKPQKRKKQKQPLCENHKPHGVFCR